MSIASLGGLMFRIIFMAVLGFGMRMRGIITDEIQKGLSSIMLAVVVPLQMLAAGNSTYSRQMVTNLLWAGVLTLGIYAFTIAVAMLARRGAKDLARPTRNILANLIILANVGYIGLPIINEIYGAEGLLYAVVFNLVFQLIAYTLCQKLAGGNVTRKNFFTNPLIICPTLAILIFASPFRLPAFVVTAFNEVGVMAAPFSMFIIGSSLGKIRFWSIFTDKYAWLVFALRQVVLPGAVGAALWALGFGGLLAPVMVVMAGMPSASLNVIFSERFGHDRTFTTKAVVLGTLLMVITLPLQALLCQAVFG